MTMTYGELKQAIQDYTENDETSFVNNLPLFIRISEERILKTVQLSLFRKNATATFSGSSVYLACPSDFLSPFSLSMTPTSGGERAFVEFKDPSFVQSYSTDNATGVPKYYCQFDVDNFLLAPAAAEDYTVELHYFYRPESITAGSENGTTWLSENAELTLLYGSLVEAYVYMKGESSLLSMYNQRFQESLFGLKQLGEVKEVTEEYRTGKLIRGRA